MTTARRTVQLPAQIQNPHHIFRLLVLYRWLSLTAPLFFLLSSPGQATAHLTPLLLAIVPNTVISFKATAINRTLRRQPLLLASDLLFVSLLIALTGGASSPYYLYALSPLIAAAYFFHLRGALFAATAITPLYILACSPLPATLSLLTSPATVDWLRVVSNLVGFYLLSGAFGYAAAILAQLRATSQELAATHSDLVVLHQITASLHSAGDETHVQEKLLEALTEQLGFRQVILGLVDESETAITSWLIHRRQPPPDVAGTAAEARGPGRLTHTARLPIDATGGLLARALSEGQICKVDGEPCTADTRLNEHMGTNNCLIVPIRWGIQPVGVLLLDCTGQVPDETRKRSLQAIARQTAVIIGMMRTRSRRARESAIQAERARIALDIHDVISQSLFGLVFTLDGSLKLLDTNPDAARAELQSALEVAERVRAEIRHTVHDMWSEEMTPRSFEQGLHTFIVDVLQAHNLAVTYDISGDLSGLSPLTWRSLYRIAQESLANAVHHGSATEVRVCLDLFEERVRLIIRDNGRGFEPDIALAHAYERPDAGARFGLRGMQERARALGGSCDIFSSPGAGASVVVDIASHAPVAARSFEISVP